MTLANEAMQHQTRVLQLASVFFCSCEKPESQALKPFLETVLFRPTDLLGLQVAGVVKLGFQ